MSKLAPERRCSMDSGRQQNNVFWFTQAPIKTLRDFNYFPSINVVQSCRSRQFFIFFFLFIDRRAARNRWMEALTPSVILLYDPQTVAVTMQRSRINAVRVPKRRRLRLSFLSTLEELEKPLVHLGQNKTHLISIPTSLILWKVWFQNGVYSFWLTNCRMQY